MTSEVVLHSSRQQRNHLDFFSVLYILTQTLYHGHLIIKNRTTVFRRIPSSRDELNK